MSFNKPTPVATLEKLDMVDWTHFLVATFKKDDSSFEQSIGNTVARFERLVANIKKSSKLLILSDTESFLPIYFASKYKCKVTVICRTEDAVKTITKNTAKYEVDKEVTVEMRDFNMTQFDYDYFDMVWSIGTLYNSEEDLMQVLREIKRILVPQGRFAICDLASENENIQEEYGIYATNEILRNASNADLEKVYHKDLTKESVAHYTYLEEHLPKAEKKINKAHGKGGYDAALGQVQRLKKLSEKGDITWTFMQLQKRNA